MSKPAKTIVVFGAYLAVIGVALVLVPNTLLTILGLPPTNEIWLRVLGMLMVIVAYYYLRTAAAESTEFFRATVHGRVTMALFLTMLAVTGNASSVLILFGLVELAGAIATHLALRSVAGP